MTHRSPPKTSRKARKQCKLRFLMVTGAKKIKASPHELQVVINTDLPLHHPIPRQINAKPNHAHPPLTYTLTDTQYLCTSILLQIKFPPQPQPSPHTDQACSLQPRRRPHIPREPHAIAILILLNEILGGRHFFFFGLSGSLPVNNMNISIYLSIQIYMSTY